MIGQVTLAFGDDEYPFCVAKNGHRMELEEATGYGTRHSLKRLMDGEETWKEIRETIRIGLIGGGMKPDQALRLVRRYVDDRPRSESVLIAQAVLLAEIAGVPDEPVGKTEAEGDETKASPSTETMADFPAPQSTASEPPSDSVRDKLTKSPFGSLSPALTG